VFAALNTILQCAVSGMLAGLEILTGYQSGRRERTNHSYQSPRGTKILGKRLILVLGFCDHIRIRFCFVLFCFVLFLQMSNKQARYRSAISLLAYLFPTMFIDSIMRFWRTYIYMYPTDRDIQ